MTSFKRFVVGVTLTLGATSAWASNFRASDTVYVPAVAKISVPGGTFLTDAVIRNHSTQAVTVDMVHSLAPNAVATARRLGTLQPGETKDYVDIVGQFFSDVVAANPTGIGQAVFFSCREGGNCSDCDANPGDCLPISVESRIYLKQTTGCANGAPECTFGQLFSGIPFYNYVSSSAPDAGLRSVVITGIRQTGARGVNGFRSNLGFTNASNTTNIRLRVRIFANDAPNTPIGTAFVPSASGFLGPLQNFQANVSTLFAGFSGNGFAIVDEAATEVIDSSNPTPGFFAYGSILDNVTSDPTTLESQYQVPLDFACVYGQKTDQRIIKR